MLPALDNRVQTAAAQSPWDLRSHWRMNLPTDQVIRLEYDGTVYEVLVEQQLDGWHFDCAGNDYQLTGSWIDQQRMRVEQNRESVEFAVVRDPDSIALAYRGQAFRFGIPTAIHGAESDMADADHPRAPMSGAVVALLVAVGDTVEAGATLMVIEAMKMEHAIVAQVSASVSEVLFAVGDQVEEGDTLVLLEVE
jgi:3-methylcrotonyl-CoA carboxylase alpha subunit